MNLPFKSQMRDFMTVSSNKNWPFPIVVNTDISQSTKITELELTIVLQTSKLRSREKKLFTQGHTVEVDKARRMIYIPYLATFFLYIYIMNLSHLSLFLSERLGVGKL